MIHYLDTSALVKRYVDEAGSARRPRNEGRIVSFWASDGDLVEAARGEGLRTRLLPMSGCRRRAARPTGCRSNARTPKRAPRKISS